MSITVTEYDINSRRNLFSYEYSTKCALVVLHPQILHIQEYMLSPREKGLQVVHLHRNKHFTCSRNPHELRIVKAVCACIAVVTALSTCIVSVLYELEAVLRESPAHNI